MKKLITILVLAILIVNQSLAKQVELETESNEELKPSAYVIVPEERIIRVKDESAEVHMSLPKIYEKTVNQILAELPEFHSKTLRNIIADYDSDAKRGLASYRTIYLGVTNIKNIKEFRRIFIHEMGHVTDLGALRTTDRKEASNFKDGSNRIYEGDPSLDFYRICWNTETEKKKQCGDSAFPSVYAQTDVFEDFAESYLLYMEDNESFKEMAKLDEILAKKYEYFRDVVFKDHEIAYNKADLPVRFRVWDLTKEY